ncbi:MAG: hypothetical protein DHS20C18_24980 [Saprospiraceae bacterium]|nr:MAG: hypothetical protein DHS20C18_24980 [Saprospiraceae bacterium]
MAAISFTSKQKRLQAGMQWLLRSVDVTNGKGSSAYYHLLHGWAPAYPETTGYLIETLLALGKHLNEPQADRAAMQCVNWLCDIQSVDGSIPSDFGGKGNPIIFDNGQILFGFLAAYKYSGDKKYRSSLDSCSRWLLQQINKEQNTWTKHQYVPNYSPAYNTRVIWALLAVNEILKDEDLQLSMINVLAHYCQKIQSNGVITDWGFHPKHAAYTHTIAYTIRGILESSILLKDESSFNKALWISDTLMKQVNQDGAIAGKYDERWNGQYNFVCPVGHAQLSILFGRLYQLTERTDYLEFSQKLLNEIVDCQSLNTWSPFYGGIPGSKPFYGPYQRWKCINWGAKFFLDALLFQHALLQKKEL